MENQNNQYKNYEVINKNINNNNHSNAFYDLNTNINQINTEKNSLGNMNNSTKINDHDYKGQNDKNLIEDNNFINQYPNGQTQIRYSYNPTVNYAHKLNNSNPIINQEGCNNNKYYSNISRDIDKHNSFPDFANFPDLDFNNSKKNVRTDLINKPQQFQNISNSKNNLNTKDEFFRKSSDHSEKNYKVYHNYKFQKDKLYILDNIIENINFTKYHLVIILICIMNIMLDGYLQFLLQKFAYLSYKYYQWEKHHNLEFLVGQQLVLALGALVSTNTRSIHWDVSSNFLVSFIGCLSLLFLNIYSDSVSFVALISVYSLCHGFIANICTNYLIEITNLKYRAYFYSLTYSFKIFGMFISVLVFFILSNTNITKINMSPVIFTLALPIGELVLSVLLLFHIDSLRVLFYNDEIALLFQHLIEINFLNDFTGIKYFDVDLQKKNYVLNLENKYDINFEVYEKAFYENTRKMAKNDSIKSFNILGDGKNPAKSEIDNENLKLKLLPNEISEFHIYNEKPTNPDDNNIYFNPSFTDDFLFKKEILKKFEDIKKKIEEIYGIQENHGVFNSFYVLMGKYYYINTFTSILFILIANLILMNVHYIYPELNKQKFKLTLEIKLNDPLEMERNSYNLNNEQLLFYYLSLFVSFNLLSIIQHAVMNMFLNYNSIFSYDSVKNLDKENNPSFSNLKNNYQNQDNNLLENQNDRSILLDDYFKNIQKSIKFNLKRELEIAGKINKYIHLTCLIIISLVLFIFIIINGQNIFLLFFFDLFIMYYNCLIYYHFSQATTTLLRNCTTSIMYLTICLLTVTQNFVNFNISYVNMLVLCLLLTILLIILDILLINHKISYKGLQKIEFSIRKIIKNKH